MNILHRCACSKILLKHNHLIVLLYCTYCANYNLEKKRMVPIIHCIINFLDVSVKKIHNNPYYFLSTMLTK